MKKNGACVSAQEIYTYLENYPLDGPAFEKIIEIMAQKAFEYRALHNGHLPLRIFLGTMKLSGTSICTEIIPLYQGKPVLALRKAEDSHDETDWVGKYHIPGVTHLCGEKLEDAAHRLLRKEVFTDTDCLVPNDYRPVAVTKVYETSRKTWGYTFTYTVDIKDISSLSKNETWLCITEDNLGQVIDEHKPIVKMFLRKKKIPKVFEIS